MLIRAPISRSPKRYCAVNDNVTAGAQRKTWYRALVHRVGKAFLRSVIDFQGRHSLIPATPVLSNQTFDWLPRLAAGTGKIRAEFDTVWQHPEDIPSFHQIAPDQARISKGTHWKTYALYIFGQPVTDNCRACPETAALLASLPGLLNAWFSILAPGYTFRRTRAPPARWCAVILACAFLPTTRAAGYVSIRKFCTGAKAS